MNKRNLEILKELAETEDCSIHWNSEYNIALREAIEIIEEYKQLSESKTLVKRYFKLKDNSIPISKVKEKFQNKRNEIFGLTYVDKKQWQPFDKALSIINDLEKELLEEREDK